MNQNGRAYFGTDGVRGTVGTSPMTAEFAMKLANAAARVLAPNGGTVLIGKDTRLSGYLFESALEAGFVSAGVDVLLAGPLPTPGIAYLTEFLRCDFGVVISASHNHYQDNGIKFFDSKGEKLSDEVEREIEKLIESGFVSKDSEHLGKATRVDEMREKYEDFCVSTVPTGTMFDGIKVIVDCANGAAYKAAPSVFTYLGAETLAICDTPDGKNINEECGATNPKKLVSAVVAEKFDVGVALDGDGDRLIMADEKGNKVDGDQLLFALARDRKERGLFRGSVIGTVMSNFGLEIALKSAGIDFKRASVGDRYVKELMVQSGSNLGGEPSGHLLFLDIAKTGDGIVSALQVLELMKRTGQKLSEMVADVKMFPQILINVPVSPNFDINAPSVKKATESVEKELDGKGRLILRASGTEPLVRVMVEHEEEKTARALAESVAKSIA